MSQPDDRVVKLAAHFDQAQRDTEQIQSSTGKITKRDERMRGKELS